MKFFELEADDISSLSDGDLRELVARLCEAELTQQGIQSSCVSWGGAQEAADGGLDVVVRSPVRLPNPNFVPRENTGFQVKKSSMGKAACKSEMQDGDVVKPVIEDLAGREGAYVIVSGCDDCSLKMLTARLEGMKEAAGALKGKQKIHLDFYGRDRLSAWLRRHPSVALWVRTRLGKPLTGWKPFGRWAATPFNLQDDFLYDDHPCVIDMNSCLKEPQAVSEGIQLVRSRLRVPGSSVRVTGLSGVGKTRFVQALFEPAVGVEALPDNEVVYADLGSELAPSASELINYLIANDFTTYIVLDNCPPDVHRALQKQVGSADSKLRIITVEYDVSDDRPEETEVIHIEPASEDIASKLVQARFPVLGLVNSDRIAEFSGGNARVALALATRVAAEETLSNFSDEELFTRLFSQRRKDSSELLVSAEALALVYSFNVSHAESCDELGVLGSIVGIPRQVLHRAQAELLRRQLVQKRGNWRAILPHALANRLAKRALQNISLNEINAELFKPDNLRLFISCAHRLGYLHDVEQARELALSWVEPGAPLGNISACSSRGLDALKYVAPVFPEVVLRMIERAAEVPNFASRENPNFARFVHLLYQISYEDEHFDRAVDVLLKFAETERVGENNNSIVWRMRKLFSLHLSGTQATPERRQAYIQKLLDSGIEKHRFIARELLRSAFESRNWTSSGEFHFGARRRGAGWMPKTNDEVIAWYVGFMRLLKPLFVSPKLEEQQWAKGVLASHFRGLWSFGKCFDYLEEIVREYGRGGEWPEVWSSIKTTLHFDGDRHASELLSRLKVLEKITAPADCYAEILAYAMVEPWSHIEVRGGSSQEKTDEIYDKVVSLGRLAASRLEYLDRLGARLWESHVQPLSWFGRGLGMGSDCRDLVFDVLLDSFCKHQSERANIFVLDGYINGVHELDSCRAQELLGRVLKVPDLKPFVLSLLMAVPISPWAYRKILELAGGGEYEAFRFEKISYGRVHKALTDRELAALLGKINELDGGFISTIRILSMRFFGAGEGMSSDELCSVARQAILQLALMDKDDLRKAQLDGIDHVFEAAFNSSAPKSEVREIIEALCDGLESSRLYAFELGELIGSLVRNFPELTLDVVFDPERGPALGALLFRDGVEPQNPTLNDAPVERILDWCGADQDRLVMVAKAVNAFLARAPNTAQGDNAQSIYLSEHIKEFFHAAADKLAMVEIIYDDIRPNCWSGSLAVILEKRSKAFAELLEFSAPEVQVFVRKKLTLLEHRIRMEREYDAARNSDREQRFE